MTKKIKDIHPLLEGEFHPNINPNDQVKWKKPILIRCQGTDSGGLRCKNYVSKTPSNVKRDIKKYNEELGIHYVSVFCENKLCQSQKTVIPRKVTNPLSEKRPLVSSLVADGKNPRYIPYKSSTELLITCPGCNEPHNINLMKIKEDAREAWHVYCDKNCKLLKKQIKSKVCKKLGSYIKTPIPGRTFSSVHPDITKDQHESCTLDLTQEFPYSSKVGVFSCRECGAPIAKQLSSAESMILYCDRGEECKNQKEAVLHRRDMDTRLKKVPSLAQKYPNIAETWVRCVSRSNALYSPSNVTTSSTIEVEWNCEAHAHSFIRSIEKRVNNPHCPTCTIYASKMQIRFALELEAHLRDHLKNDIEHSKKFDLSDGKNVVEIDIPLLFQSGRKVAIELDGYEWHRKKLSEDNDKNKRLKHAEWEVIRLRDERLTNEKIITEDCLEYSFKGNQFYAEQWREVIASLINELGYSLKSSYTHYIADDKYQKEIKKLSQDIDV